MAAGIFSRLKQLGVEVDYVPELVRMAHYTNNQTLLKDELMLMADKSHRLLALQDAGIEVAVSDGAILNSIVYHKEDYFPSFDQMVHEVHQSFTNINFLIPGVRPGFSGIGRGEQELEKALERGRRIIEMLDRLQEPYATLDPDANMALEAVHLSGLDRSRFKLAM